MVQTTLRQEIPIHDKYSFAINTVKHEVNELYSMKEARSFHSSLFLSHCFGPLCGIQIESNQLLSTIEDLDTNAEQMKSPGW